MEKITINQIVAVNSCNQVVLRHQPPGYNPFPYATAIRCCEADIIANQRVENGDAALEAEINSQLRHLLRIGD